MARSMIPTSEACPRCQQAIWRDDRGGLHCSCCVPATTSSNSESPLWVTLLLGALVLICIATIVVLLLAGWG